ncbi:hypothetical protein VM1G_04556 [Cytospora mali]|uniref:Uncharacterized protein n=1 Tax=Cytospora mali TaxID=578113 RepID=A0A194VXU2_CYTMA|nr:hypothetical protein VM1G_04556 [Valsa mali]
MDKFMDFAIESCEPLDGRINGFVIIYEQEGQIVEWLSKEQYYGTVTLQPARVGSAALQEMMRRGRTKALFGDSPPPPRQHAPFPDGEAMYNCHKRHVSRHGDAVAKFTTATPAAWTATTTRTRHSRCAPSGSTPRSRCPEVTSSDRGRITMQYVEGQTLRQAWPVLTPDERSGILAQLSEYIAQMRALGGIYVGRLDGREGGGR